MCRVLHFKARRAIGDFGVPITIIVMVLVDYLIPETFIEVVAFLIEFNGYIYLGIYLTEI